MQILWAHLWQKIPPVVVQLLDTGLLFTIFVEKQNFFNIFAFLATRSNTSKVKLIIFLTACVVYFDHINFLCMPFAG